MISADIRAFLDGQRIARLATVDQQGRPHVVPICFALAGETLYSAIDEKPKHGEPSNLRRIRNIASMPHVQVLFDHYDDSDWGNLRFVQVRGRARVLEGGEEHRRATEALRARYQQYRDMNLEHRPVIVIDVDRVVSWP
jgi:PPOX class probable F420-dependent enzyme